MKSYSYRNQIQTVLLIELLLLGIVVGVAYFFWTSLCGESLQSCVSTNDHISPITFLGLSALRPFVLTPLAFLAVLAGKAYGVLGGTLLTALGSCLSCLVVLLIARLIGRRMARPWLAANLPATWKLIRSQDYKIVFFLRLIPIIPFDFFSLVFGVLGFRMKNVLLWTFVGTLPEAFFFARAADPDQSVMQAAINSILTFAIGVALILLVYEFFARKKGTSLWRRIKAAYEEIIYEMRTNNDIVRRHSFTSDKTPILLLYGFFSSRRALTILERQLVARGHQVMSFNLGGLFGIFNTRSILETSSFLDYKIKRQIDRYGFKKIHIVSHSKGGLVALWWLLKMGGNKYCDKVITLGTPFGGSVFTYLALVTPLGFLWKDVWQMRPGSGFLKSLKRTKVPENLDVYCFHSQRDNVARGPLGVFRPQDGAERVHPITMNHISHFEFLYRRDICDALDNILRKGIVPDNQLAGKISEPDEKTA